MRLVTSPTARKLLTVISVGLAATLMTPTAAVAADPPAPGNFKGYGFDACVAPNQKVMDAWNLKSPFTAIGIYISGNSRYCGDAYQPNLSKAWVAQNADNGWRFIPIHVGYQAPCFKNNPKSRVQKKKMSTTVSTARSQGVADANETIAALKKYGFGSGSVSYLDIEWYARTTACDNIVLQFADAWTERLHDEGYKSGLYSSGSAAIKAFDEARIAGRGFTFPDHMWIAWTNKVANTDGGSFLSDSGWNNHQRIHQFDNGVDATYGGYTVNIDWDFLDVGKGSVATKKIMPCDVNITFSSYPKLELGSKGTAVSALQCLLTRRGFPATVSGTFTTNTLDALLAFRKSRDWPKKTYTTRPTWTALLAYGYTPRVLKQGSIGESVWRLQRALTAAGLKPSLNGIYDPKTVTAVKTYRENNDLPRYSTTESTVWTLLQRGRTA
ncbi:peptidoglycan hydrolase-like protein with peptidoglycan-binding domain [Aeromicrobium panaciterrae]|uniref:Peptidoglycan hydrolase-like protein with peptidoglycan-binding domain n=1 Tax=Aeromicrobium panaciterrae TaxID=363861 RepID=A0ABU1UKW4_9ACTN|nr:glycoside hydrolase domain-containing protein [Aeromicrobium panaciterrae]MDR7085833.1 peptidoglycan hydrolase-like protein with peptidoglycan-binding domain [Aeromicrobium panaciterrae]